MPGLGQTLTYCTLNFLYSHLKGLAPLVPRSVRSQPLSIDPADSMASVGTLGGEMAACRRWSAENADHHHSTHPSVGASRKAAVGVTGSKRAIELLPRATLLQSPSVPATLQVKSFAESRALKSCAAPMLAAAASCAAARKPANLNVPAAPAHEVGSTSGFLGGMHG